MCVLIVPPLISFVWICGFGGMAVKFAMGGDKIASLVDKDYTVALFELLSKFPLSDITSGLAILLIFYSLSQVLTQQHILLQEWQQG